ncbi:hypothetical protein D6817_04530 [Candidatus Pacearchaeota archaeon]|nr:MAG: hypothetical protein D6817_04530 [Candidatus Pacearchaeota archaeon]
MVVDMRRYAPEDLVSKIALVSSNVVDKGGSRVARIFRGAKRVNGKQINLIGGVNYAGEVGYDQGSAIGGVNYAGRVHWKQGGIVNLANIAGEFCGSQGDVIGGVNYAGEVGGSQGSLINLANIARKVRDNQGSIISGVNYAREVGRDQVGMINLTNIARRVNGDQFSGIGGVNYARKVYGKQSGGVLCIQTENRAPRQERCLIRYNPSEGLGIGSSAWAKLERARRYFSKMEESIESEFEFYDFVEQFVREKPTLRKRITGHWTYKDALSKVAKQILRQRDKEQELERKVA